MKLFSKGLIIIELLLVVLAVRSDYLVTNVCIYTVPDSSRLNTCFHFFFFKYTIFFILLVQAN